MKVSKRPATAGQRASGRAPVAPKRRKYRSADEITGSIRQAALEEFKKNGFDRSTTANIAKRADVIEAQIFQYFRSKSNLFRNAVFDTLNSQLDEVSETYHWEEGSPPEAETEPGRTVYTERLHHFLAENIDLIRSLFIANAYGAFEMPNIGVEDSLARYFEHGTSIMRRQVTAEGGVPPELMVRISFGAVLGCVMFQDWLFPKGLAKDADVVADITKFVLAGLQATYHPEDTKSALKTQAKRTVAKQAVAKPDTRRGKTSKRD